MFRERLLKMPYIGTLGARMWNYWRSKSDKNTMSELREIPHSTAKIVHKVLIDLKEKKTVPPNNWHNRIETERKRLLNNKNPLVDGSFEYEGLFDSDKTIQQACTVSRDAHSALFLYLLTCSLQPNRIIELGTNLGISSAYIGAAIQGNIDKNKLVTLDASPYRQKLAKEVHHNVGLKNIEYVQGLFRDTLESTLKKMEYIDLAFIDGHHEYEPTLEYLEKIYSFSHTGTVFLLDDIRYSDGMKKAWAEIADDIRFDLVIDLKNIGICVCAGNNTSERFEISTIYQAF